MVDSIDYSKRLFHVHGNFKRDATNKRTYERSMCVFDDTQWAYEKDESSSEAAR